VEGLDICARLDDLHTQTYFVFRGNNTLRIVEEKKTLKNDSLTSYRRCVPFFMRKMQKIFFLACLLALAVGGRTPRVCPCVECDINPKGNIRDNRTWKLHATEIATGARHRVAGIGVAPDRHDIPSPDRQDIPAQAEEEIEDEPNAEVPRLTSIERLFSMEMAELVANNIVSVTGMEEVLKSAHRRYDEHLPEDVHMPPSWYLAKKGACKGKEPKWFTRDYCPKCDYGFEVNPADTKCPRCEEDTRFDHDGKAPRQAYYFEMDDKIKRVFAAKLLARSALPPTDRPMPDKPIGDRELTSAFDGKILQKLYYESEEKTKDETMYFACSNDGVEVEKGVSYTPITAKLLNFPTALRGLLASIWLLGCVLFNPVCVCECVCVCCVCGVCGITVFGVCVIVCARVHVHAQVLPPQVQGLPGHVQADR
jgi:hypothetical protein